jgi:hypothetical protein
MHVIDNKSHPNLFAAFAYAAPATTRRMARDAEDSLRPSQRRRIHGLLPGDINVDSPMVIV